MKFLDSNVLAYSFYENERLPECQKAIKEGGLINTFNLIEAFFIIEKETGNREIAQRSIRGLLKSNLIIAEVDVNLVFEVLKRIKESKFSVFDAVHYTCALMNNCNVILSYDKDFDKLDIPREEP
ncbi:PIN domain-containing protein [Candidatus Woesearchaeota archaeon]|nr:PIN domain-containing protein [Candidatus Woesearchaeota archaeon]MBI2130756.1 PIN domain-containing protein [Candidatus Woesearchaeota archaeon]MBI2661567.1 PIN domain-containing protein [Candidatus Woesearchaeota archaeon]